MKVKAIISAALFMVCTIASAQTEKKYYMNVQTAPEEVQSYEVNSNLKVSWEQTQKGTTPSGYYSKDEVDAMLKEIKDFLIGERTIDEAKYLIWPNACALDNLLYHEETFREHQRHLEDICCLLTGSRDRLDDIHDYYRDFFYPGGVLKYINSEIPYLYAKPETTLSMELMEENKVLKNKLAELERRLEALEAKK